MGGRFSTFGRQAAPDLEAQKLPTVPDLLRELRRGKSKDEVARGLQRPQRIGWGNWFGAPARRLTGLPCPRRSRRAPALPGNGAREDAVGSGHRTACEYDPLPPRVAQARST